MKVLDWVVLRLDFSAARGPVGRLWMGGIKIS